MTARFRALLAACQSLRGRQLTDGGWVKMPFRPKPVAEYDGRLSTWEKFRVEFWRLASFLNSWLVWITLPLNVQFWILTPGCLHILTWLFWPTTNQFWEAAGADADAFAQAETHFLLERKCRRWIAWLDFQIAENDAILGRNGEGEP